MKKYIWISIAFLSSILIQKYLKLSLKVELISTLLTVFSIFFGFYVTSFAVFATSKYLTKLYKIQNENDNRKTLLDDLLEEFTFATKFLLTSIVYLTVCYVIIENYYTSQLLYASYVVWGFLLMNIYFSFTTISIFIKVTRQSAKAN